jgi:hypothetical protein
VKTQVTVTFFLESVKKLNSDQIENQVMEKIIGNGEVNWFDNSETHAIFDIDSLETTSTNID